MDVLLGGVAGLLMLVSVALFFRQNSSATAKGNSGRGSKHKPFLTLLVVSGTLIAFGGYWISWLLWVGLILIEVGCIAYHAGINPPRAD